MMNFIPNSILNYMTNKQEDSFNHSFRFSFFRKILNSLEKRNNLIELSLSILSFYVQFHMVILILSNMCNIAVNDAALYEGKQLEFFGSNKLGEKIVYYFSFGDFYSYVNDKEYDKQEILFYVINASTICYFLFIYLISYVHQENKIFKIFYIIHVLFTKVLAMSFLRVNFQLVVVLVEKYYNTSSSVNTFIIILDVFAFIINIYLIFQSEMLINDLNFFNRKIHFFEYSLEKQLVYLFYLIITVVYTVLSDYFVILKQNHPDDYSTLVEKGLNSYMFESFIYLSLIKCFLICYYIYQEIKFPFYLETSMIYYKFLDKIYIMALDLIFNIPYILLTHFDVYEAMMSIEGFFLSVIGVMIFLVIMRFLISETKNRILSMDVNSIKDSRLAMCFVVLFWNLTLEVEINNRKKWLLENQLDLHKLNCYDDICVCQQYNSINIDYIKFQLEKQNYNNLNNENYFYYEENLNQNQVDLIKILKADLAEDSDIYKNDEKTALVKHKRRLNQQFFYVLLTKLNNNIPKENSYFILVQAFLITYISKSYFQGIHRLMVLENNINLGYKLVKYNYEFTKADFIDYKSKQLFAEEDILNIKKITKFEKHYEILSTNVLKSMKKFIKIVKIQKKNEINELEFYNSLESLIIDLEIVQKEYNTLSILIPNELRVLKLMCFINCILLDNIDTSQNMYSQFLSTLSNKISMAHRSNIYFKDNAGPGILCFSGNLNNLATITYCNQRFHKLLDQEDNTLVGTNVNNIMHELFAKHHDYFILNFYRTNKIHNINKDNVVYAQSNKNLLVPLKQCVKVLPSLKEGIFYVGYDLEYRSGNRFSEGYLLFDPHHGFIYSFDSTIKTLFNLNAEHICINSNNHSDILSIEHLFKGVIKKLRGNEILDNIEFEVEINFLNISEELKRNNITEDTENNVSELKEIVDNVKQQSNVISVTASIARCQISNGIIKFAIFKLRLNNLILHNKTISHNEEAQQIIEKEKSNNININTASTITNINNVLSNNLNSKLGNLPSSDLNSINKSNNKLSHRNKNINMMELKKYFAKLGSFSTITGNNSFPRLSKYMLVINIIIIVVLIVFIGVYIMEYKDFNSSFMNLFDNQKSVWLMEETSVNIIKLTESYYYLKLMILIYNSDCYDDKLTKIQNMIDSYFDQTSTINKLMNSISKDEELIKAMTEYYNQNLDQSDTTSTTQELVYYYYQINIKNIEGKDVDITKYQPEKYEVNLAYLFQQPLNDLNDIYNDMIKIEGEDIVLLRRQKLVCYWNIILEISKFTQQYKNSNNIKINDYFVNSKHKVILVSILTVISIFILFSGYIIMYVDEKRQKSILVKCFVSIDPESFNKKVEMANMYEPFIKYTDSDMDNFGIIDEYLNNKSYNYNFDVGLSFDESRSIAPSYVNFKYGNTNIPKNPNNPNNKIDVKDGKEGKESKSKDNNPNTPNIMDDSETAGLRNKKDIKNNASTNNSNINDKKETLSKNKALSNNSKSISNVTNSNIKKIEDNKSFVNSKPSFMTKLNQKNTAKEVKQTKVFQTPSFNNNTNTMNNSNNNISTIEQDESIDSEIVKAPLSEEAIVKLKIKQNFSYDLKIFFTILCLFLVFSGLTVLTSYLNINSFFKLENSLKVANTYHERIFSMKKLANVKYYNELGFSFTESFYNYTLTTMSNAKEDLNSLNSYIKTYSSLEFIDEVIIKFFSPSALCEFYADRCCDYKHMIDYGLKNFLLFLEQTIINNYMEKEMINMYDIFYIYLYDFIYQIKSELNNIIIKGIDDFLNYFWLKLGLLCIWIVFVCYIIWYQFWQFLKQTQRNEKIISIIPKKSLTSNNYLMKLIKEF